MVAGIWMPLAKHAKIRKERGNHKRAQKTQNGFFVVYVPFVAIYLLFRCSRISFASFVPFVVTPFSFLIPHWRRQAPPPLCPLWLFFSPSLRSLRALRESILPSSFLFGLGKYPPVRVFGYVSLLEQPPEIDPQSFQPFILLLRQRGS